MADEGFKRKLTAVLSAAIEVLRIDPDFSIEYFAKTSPIKDPADRKRLISALRKAGLL